MKVNLITIVSFAFLLIQISCKEKNYNDAGLYTFDNFGSNPGNLNAYYYKPQNVTSNSPLLLVLHGCTQGALEIAKETALNKLADEHGFYVLYPEQRTINNATKCFNWFLPNDITKDKGEIKSIEQMISAFVQENNINSSRIYITGLSAGGAMSMAMISAYPNIFRGAAIMSGGPYRGANNVYESIDLLKGLVQKTPQEWGDLVRSENPGYTGTYPKLCVVHGVDDNVVNYQNAIEIVKQWTNVLNVNLQDKTTSSINTDVKRISYFDASNEEQVRLYEISNLGHAIAVDPGNGVTQGGGSGQYTKDKDFYSGYWIAKFMGLIQ